MEAKARLKFARISWRKMRLVADEVRGKNAGRAIAQLKFVPKKGANMMRKLLESAVANASDNATVDVDRLYIKEVTVDQAMPIKRWRPCAQGRAHPFKKYRSHVNIVLDEK